MKPDQLYQELKDLAEKLNITISEQNLRKTGIKVKSGLCKVKGKYIFVMDKSKSVRDKIEILASCLRSMPTDDIYIIPAVRDILEKGRPVKGLVIRGQRSEHGAKRRGHSAWRREHGAESKKKRSEISGVTGDQ